MSYPSLWRGAAVSLALGVCAGMAHAQAFPQSHLKLTIPAGNRVVLEDLAGGPAVPLINPSSALERAVYSAVPYYWQPPYNPGDPDFLVGLLDVSAEMRPHHAYEASDDYVTPEFLDADGFDIVVTMYNKSKEPLEQGEICLSGIKFGIDDPCDPDLQVITLRKTNGNEAYQTGYVCLPEGEGKECTPNFYYAYGFERYPMTLGAYAPVAVLHGGEQLVGCPTGLAGMKAEKCVPENFGQYTVGVSLSYDHFKYKHQVQPHLMWYGSDQGWRITFSINPGNAINHDEALLPPGETRVYTMSVRVLKGCPESANESGPATQNWLHTVRPYQLYYDKAMAEIAPANSVARDLRPVWGIELSNDGYYDLFTNPYAFTFTGTTSDPSDPFDGTRVDIGGWSQLADVLEYFRDIQGWRRFMIWTPCGDMPQSISPSPYATCESFYSYPSDITIAWNSDADFRSSDTTLTSSGLGDPSDMVDWTDNNTDCELGIWWGYSSRIFKHSAEDSVVTMPPTSLKWYHVNSSAYDYGFKRYDITDVSHDLWSDKQMDGCLETGATFVGLDTFLDWDNASPSCGGDSYIGLSPWDAYLERIPRLHTLYPSVRFLTEPAPPDFIHRTAGGFYLRQNGQEPTQTHALADMLNPNHETYLQYKQTSTVGTTSTLALANDAAALGFIPIVTLWHDDAALGVAPNDAVNTVPFTVPTDLQGAVPALEIWPQPPATRSVVFGMSTTLHVDCFAPSDGPDYDSNDVNSFGDFDVTYEWYFKGVSDPDYLPVSSIIDYSGMTTKHLTILSAKYKMNGSYKCLVTSKFGSAYSDICVLTVTP